MKPCFIVAVILLLASSALGGAEFRVNQHTDKNQGEPDMAMAPDGGFVVVWTSDGQDGSASGIYCRMFDASGVARGDEFLVNQTTAYSQSRPCLAMDGAGNFVVGWQLTGSPSIGIYARRYNAQGEPLSAEFRVDTPTVGTPYTPSIAMNDQGDFVLAWQSMDYPVHHGRCLMGRAFRADGTARGGDFIISSNPFTDKQAITMFNSGDFVVFWRRWGSETPDFPPLGFYLYMRRFDLNGSPAAAAVVLADTTHLPVGSVLYYEPSAALDADENVTVVWEGAMQRFRPDGSVLTDKVLIDPTSQWEFFPRIGVADDGRFLMSFISGDYNQPSSGDPGDGDQRGVFGCWMAADGSPLGPVMRINNTKAGDQTSPDCAVSPDGEHAVVVWVSEDQDGSGSGVYAKVDPEPINAVPGWTLWQ